MFDNEISQAILVLKDDNLVWSSDFEGIRKHLAGLLERALQNEYHYLEPEIGDLALKLIRERENDARKLTTTQAIDCLCSSGTNEQAGKERSGHSCCRPF
jgi:hypothetical protein